MATKHFLLTRFNLHLYKRDKYFRTINPDRWLEHRFELFERFCLPSIAAQTTHDFEWLILFDKHTPQVYKERIKRHVQKYPFISPIAVEAQYGCYYPQIFQKAIRNRLEKAQQNDEQATSVLTTRLDNDDALAPDFVARVQAASQDLAPRSFITFRYGVQYFTELEIALKLVYPHNHFLTYVETPDKDHRVQTAYAFGDHTNLFNYPNVFVHELKDEDNMAWMEVVHTKNVANDALLRLQASLIEDRELLERTFALGLPMAVNPRAVYQTRFRIRKGREIVRKLLTRLRNRLPRRWASNMYLPQ